MRNILNACLTTVVCIIYMACSTPKTITHTKIYCDFIENGIKISKPVFVENNPAVLYDPVISKTDLSFKGSIDILDKIKLASIDAGIIRNTILLREKLNQFNITQQDLLRASYIRSNNRPCDTATQNAHTLFISENAKRNFALAELTASLNSLTSNGTIIRYSDGNKIQFILNSYKQSIKDTSILFEKPQQDTLENVNRKSSGYYFDETPTGSVRLKNISNVYNDPRVYYPENGTLDLDSITLNKNFIIEANVRSLNTGSGPYGLIYNAYGSIDGLGYYLLYTDYYGYTSVCAGVNRDSTKRYVGDSFQKLIFNQRLNINITEFHKLKIKKAGEILEYYIDDLKVHSTNLTRIEVKKFRLYAEPGADCLFDYFTCYY